MRKTGSAADNRSCKIVFVLPTLFFALLTCSAAQGQIGGHTAAQGLFLLDDAEDLDLVADGVKRNWVPDYVDPFGYVLNIVLLANEAGLNLTVGQSPQGALRFATGIADGYVDAGFGVPMPSVLEQSTLTHPGNITSFRTLQFLFCSSTTLPNQNFQVILETYPGPPYPKIYWTYTPPAAGAAFQRVEIDLWKPTKITDANGLTLRDLLSKTRFLYFYFHGGPAEILTGYSAWIDDIQLAGPPLARVNQWTLYR